MNNIPQLNVVLFFVIIGLILVTAMFWLFNKRSKVRNRIHIARLRQTLDVCQKITASIPVDVTDESEIVYAISESIQPDMEQLFGATEIRIGMRNGVKRRHQSNEECESEQTDEPKSIGEAHRQHLICKVNCVKMNDRLKVLPAQCFGISDEQHWQLLPVLPGHWTME